VVRNHKGLERIRTLLVKRNPLHFRLHVKSLAVGLGKVRSVLRVLDGEGGPIHSQRSKHTFADGIFPAFAIQLSNIFHSVSAVARRWRRAFFSGNGSTTAATENLVIKSASVSRPDNQHYKITINVQNLTRLVVPPTLAGPMQSGLHGGKLRIRTELVKPESVQAEPEAAGSGGRNCRGESGSGQPPVPYQGRGWECANAVVMRNGLLRSPSASTNVLRNEIVFAVKSDCVIVAIKPAHTCDHQLKCTPAQIIG